PVEAGPRQARAQGYLAVPFGASLEFLQRALDLFAARALRLVILPLGGRLGLGDGIAPVLRLPFSRQQRIDEDPGQAADGGGGEGGEREVLHFHGGPLLRFGDFGGVDRRGKPLLLAVITRTLPEARPADAGGAMLADNLAVGILADEIIDEDVLGDDGV